MAFSLEIIISTVTVAVMFAVHRKSVYVRYIRTAYVKMAKAIDFNYFLLNSTCLYNHFDILDFEKRPKENRENIETTQRSYS